MALILNPITALGSAIRGRNATQTAQDDQGRAFAPRADVYALRRGYYESTAYDLTTTGFGSIKVAAGLPRNIREVMPIAKLTIDWWNNHLYPGIWTSDGRPAGNGRPNRIPWESDVSDELLAPVHQAFSWGNWGDNIDVWSWFGPMYGDVFAEVEVDYERRKVYPIVHDPSSVCDLEVNRSGDVTSYRLDIPQWDPETKRTYTWGKRVTKDTITTYYNGEPRGFNDQPAETVNPFGFVPAVWWMFRNFGALHGGSAFEGMYKLNDDLNGMQSAVNDFILKYIHQKYFISTKDPAMFNKMIDAQRKGGPTFEQSDPNHAREELDVMAGPEGSQAFPLIQNLGLAEAGVHFDRMMNLLERTVPEIVVELKLGDSAQVSGPGARAIAAPAQRKLDKTAGGSDSHLVKLGQMCTSIMGELVNTIWRGGLTDQQRKFSPYSLKSWDRGDLDNLAVAPRDLVQATIQDRALEAMSVEKVQTIWGLKHSGLSSVDIYGPEIEGKEPPPDPGILADRQSVQAASSVNLGSLFNSGGAP